MTSSPPFRKKLIEVALPLEAINKESAREKSIRHGHPSTLHLWWARRPLAACRAVLFASLVDDPSAWPEIFPTEKEQETERQRLFSIIEELILWKNSTNDTVISKAQAEIARSLALNSGDIIPKGGDAIRKYITEHAPLVFDPFCGGGSIPLEAQRLGLEAHASDLNPVAVLITKALIEIPPKFAGLPPVNPESRRQKHIANEWEGAKGLAEDVRYYGQRMRDEAEKRIGHLYPKVKVNEEIVKDRPDLKQFVRENLTVIAWLWARTVASPNPAVHGAHVPLVKSFWLSKKKGKEAWIEPIVDRSKNQYHFKVRTGKPPAGQDPSKGTVNRTGGVCLISGQPIPFDHIRSEGKGGKLGNRLMAIVAEGTRGRVYLNPEKVSEDIAQSTNPQNFPLTPLPGQALSFRVQLYGMDYHYKLFTSRQLVALTTFSDLVAEARKELLADATEAGILSDDDLGLEKGGIGVVAYADAVATYLAFGVDKGADYWSSLCSWHISRETIGHTFTKQSLPMVWDFVECNPISSSTGNFKGFVNWVSKSIEQTPASIPGIGLQFDAMKSFSMCKECVMSTDPPYYDNIGYADLSDFFYIWLRRSLGEIYPSIFSTLLTPKSSELIASPYRHNGDKKIAQKFFENGLKKVFEQAHSIKLSESFPITVYYAFKQAESSQKSGENLVVSTGWETMLSSLISSGFVISGTWPIWTELKNRPVGTGTNALASSTVLVCRPRPDDAPLATRREFLTALREELPNALRTLQQGNIAPVDLAQSAIGPGMSVFTRYAKVMESDGSAMTVRTALALINQVLDEVLAEQEGEFDGDTRWAISWFEQYGINEGPYGDAETLSKAKNTAVSGLVEAGIIEARGGKVRLISRENLPHDWDPATDKRLTVWESTQYLICALETSGENGAAAILRKLGAGMGERARDLAYRLYTTCDRMKWAKEALAYNSLIISWPKIAKLTHEAERRERAEKLFFEEEE